MNIDKIYAPKRPCPQDLGLFFCNDCKAKNIEESSNADYPVRLVNGCSKIVDNHHKCGFTHLGFYWCDECVKENRATNAHRGSYEVVAIVHGEVD